MQLQHSQNKQKCHRFKVADGALLCDVSLLPGSHAFTNPTTTNILGHSQHSPIAASKELISRLHCSHPHATILVSNLLMRHLRIVSDSTGYQPQIALPCHILSTNFTSISVCLTDVWSSITLVWSLEQAGAVSMYFHMMLCPTFR